MKSPHWCWSRKCPTCWFLIKRRLWWTSLQMETNTWYLDSRASNHITREWVKFKELDEKFIGNVKFWYESLYQSKAKNPSCSSVRTMINLLTKVYYILSLKNNIISVGQMTEEGSRVKLIGSFLKIFDRNWALLMKVKQWRNCLYKILIKKLSTSSESNHGSCWQETGISGLGEKRTEE